MKITKFQAPTPPTPPATFHIEASEDELKHLRKLTGKEPAYSGPIINEDIYNAVVGALGLGF